MSIYLGDTPLANTGYDKANISLSNLTSQGKNIANWSNNVTNCITEIPQDIKLELNNGTLTLKAGSKVYVPNGAGVFNAITVPSDVVFHSGTIGTGTSDFMICCNLIGGFGVRAPSDSFVSGETAPTNTSQIWYDTTNNMIKVYENGSWVQKSSLPIGIYHRENGNAVSIKQVFNGFGYIGSTVFVLPGVKGLIPNGRNADGTLKNIEFTINSVKTYNQIQSETSVLNIYDGSIGIDISTYTYSNFFIQKNKPTQYQYMLWFDTSENIIKYTENTGSTWTKVNLFNCAKTVSTTNGIITSLTPKTAFHALNYNDSSTISGWSMPSSRSIPLTLGASGASYTAPANGYFNFRGMATAAGQYVYIGDANFNNVAFQRSTVGNGDWVVYSIPVAKGNSIIISYSTGANNVLNFIYAEGESNV